MFINHVHSRALLHFTFTIEHSMPRNIFHSFWELTLFWWFNHGPLLLPDLGDVEMLVKLWAVKNYTQADFLLWMTHF